MGFLAPGGDYAALMEFCGLKAPTEALMSAVDAAEAEMVAQCGPILSATVADILTMDAATQVLSARVASLTSVTSEEGTVYTKTDFRTRGQLLSRKDGGTIPAWATVVYTSGWAQSSIPASVILAGRMLARHLWRTTLGNQRVNESELVPGSAWLWPRQARDLVADYTLAPLGFA